MSGRRRRGGGARGRLSERGILLVVAGVLMVSILCMLVVVLGVILGR
ncbi:MAG: hypothetical protein AVDCRST_MAG49-3990 [uncultured Thermomicrobiales bacterium]|uniref:Uncharacterized protein n=1 Tax=uncultured Thermomicrobiales bacterium TaxID=1645740 RepID=A0A6J4VBN7_9BACT|nr:MAG: hypothetical protein AVDCRST_MAG49-3990 [uncultured Thermomicrobiales bacterium]